MKSAWKFLLLVCLVAVGVLASKQIWSDHLLRFRWSIFAASFAALIIAFILELIFVGWQKSSIRKLAHPSASSKRDWIIFFLDVSTLWKLLGDLFFAGIPFYLGFKLGGELRHYVSFEVSIPLFRLGFAVLISELASYWAHRLFHKVDFLWELHKYHHSAEEFNVVTARRDHPFVVPIFSFFTAIPMALLSGKVGEVGAVSFLVVSIHAMLIHSELSSSWGWLGKWFLVSPWGHRVHHSKELCHRDLHFGFITPIWDHIFGTFYKGPVQVTSLGVDDVFINRTPFLSEMYLVAKSFIQKLLSRFGW